MGLNDFGNTMIRITTGFIHDNDASIRWEGPAEE